jgi:serine/threonine protein kinase/tetratricopeptide (TPR) repeat protein
MTPERWQQVKSVFHRVRELAPEERSSFLDHACSTDDTLRREVESLLSSDEEARSVILESEMTRATLVEGTKLGDYEVRSQVGSGGMGVVYRARDLRLGRDVAIKVLPLFFASDRNRLRRFEQEARAAAALNHPNILAVHQLGTYEGSPYLVSELLHGETLRARVKRGPIPLEESMEYARQIARGLAAAHEKGIVHRDLKPENLFLTKDGQIKILDFGLAKQTRPELAEAKSEGLATEAGVVMGTVGYMSPEQVRGQRADFRSDIFAFGAILYELLSGQRAFTGDSSADVASAILNEDPPRLSRSDSHAPKPLEAVVERCLKKNPEGRFQSVEELSVALRGIEALRGRGVSLPPILTRARRRILTGVIVVAIAAAALFVYVRYSRNRVSAIDSIAVMPFASKGGDSAGDLGDGITTGLIDSLSQIPNLRVMSRTATAHYKGRDVDPQTVGRELNVRVVLTGTLTPRGDGFVLDTELVNARDDSHIWGHQYGTKPAEILSVQAALARALSEKLRPRLGSEAMANLVKSGTSNPEAYLLYVKGLYSFDRIDPQPAKAAVAYFQAAIDKDPGFAQAYSGLGEAYAFLAHSRAIPFREAIQKAKAAARRSLELDPNLADGHCALSIASHINWEWEQAEQEARRCVELNPNLLFAHEAYALILADVGKTAESVVEQKRAVEVDPISYQANYFLANIYYFSRDYDRSIEQRLKVIELVPNRADAHDMLGNAYMMKGEFDKAALEYEKSLRLQGEVNEAEALRRAYAKEGFRGLLKAQIEHWSYPTKTDDYAPYDTAANYSLLGDAENAFTWLDRAYADNEKIGANNGSMIVARIDPYLDNIRSDPRYHALLRRMGFPE